MNRSYQTQHRRAWTAAMLTRHAQGLAQIAGYLIDRQGGLVQADGLVMQYTPSGLYIVEATHGQKLLHVDSGGRVLFYQAGTWEARLVNLVQETGPC
jgi:hypothetical protein